LIGVCDLDAVVPACGFVGVELWVIDAVIDDVAEGLRAVEDWDLVFVKEIPPLVDEALPNAVYPLDFVALRSWARRLGGRQIRPRRHQRRSQAAGKSQR
jgi:hypothetical protein